MPDAVYQVMTMLCALVAPLPVGTNRGLLHLLWMLVSGRLLATRYDQTKRNFLAAVYLAASAILLN